MDRPLETLYGLGRLAFGAALLAAPGPFGAILMSKTAHKPAVRTMFRFYGTRDTALGVATLRGVSRGADLRGLLVAGIACDLLDAGVMLAEWDEIPADKQMPGIVAALGTAAAGVALLARSEVPSRP